MACSVFHLGFCVKIIGVKAQSDRFAWEALVSSSEKVKEGAHCPFPFLIHIYLDTGAMLTGHHLCHV